MKRFLYSVGMIVLSTICISCGIRKEAEYTYESQEGDMPILRVFDDRIAQEIQNRTGVRIEIMNPTEAPSEKTRLMLANGDYPDLVVTSLAAGNMAEKYAAAGAFIPLDDYIEAMGPDIKSMYGRALDDLRHDDGHIYYLTSWYGKDSEPVAGFQIRYDLLKELVGQERADSSDAFTQKEIVELLRAFYKRYPEIEGQDSIPFTFKETSSGRTLYGMFGMKDHHETENGQIQMIYKSPKYVNMLLFLNQLYREGLLEKDWMINNAQTYEEKLESGRVFMTAGAYWDMDTANAVLEEKYGKDVQYYSYKVLGEGIHVGETTYNGRNSLGWDGIGITDNCENVEAAMKVINFLASEEGQYLTLWGIESQDWDMVDGKRVPREEILALFQKDPFKTRKETGIRKWTWLTKNGNGSDGSPYDMAIKYRLSESAKRAYKNMANDYWDTAPYIGIDPEVGTKEAAIQQAIAAIGRDYYCSALYADTAMEAEQIYMDMLVEMEQAGIKQVEKAMNERYQKNKK